MSQSLAKILVHIVFSTKNRQAFLTDKALRDELHRYLAGVLTGLDCPPVIVGGAEDHIHILCALSRTRTPSEIVKEVKRVSSQWIKKEGTELASFSWQNGYGIFSIGDAQIAATTRYIANQEEHHRTKSFQEEYLDMLRRYQMDYDERYVWD